MADSRNNKRLLVSPFKGVEELVQQLAAAHDADGKPDARAHINAALSFVTHDPMTDNILLFTVSHAWIGFMGGRVNRAALLDLERDFTGSASGRAGEFLRALLGRLTPGDITANVQILGDAALFLQLKEKFPKLTISDALKTIASTKQKQ